MEQQLNKVHHKNWMENGLQDKSVQLIIADPPYFEVKGDFDFVWKSFDDYLKDVEIWARECKRVLADNGTLLWYGDRLKIAYSQIIFDKYFNLESNVTIHVTDRQTNKNTTEDARCFINTTERVLMYSNEIGKTGLQKIKLDVENFKPLRQYFKYIQHQLGIPKSEIINKIGQGADHPFRWGSSQWDMPTEKTYSDLISIFRIDELPCFKSYEPLGGEYRKLRSEYESFRLEYEKTRRPFNPHELYKMDVIRASQEAHITKNYTHDTKKPETLTRVLISTCSRPNDLILVPFSGSGTECAMAAREGRQFVGFDTVSKYVDMANARVKLQLNKPTLF